MILLIGLDSDLHVDAVVIELKRRGTDYIRINPQRINQNNTYIRFTIGLSKEQAAVIDTYSGRIETANISGVLCRYALEALEGSPDEGYSEFCAEEFFVALRGALLQIPLNKWINDPFMEARADNKPYQLYMANQCGLPVLPSLVSQDRATLVKFSNDFEACVIKPLGNVSLVNSDQNGKCFASYTARLDTEHLLDDSWDESCPVFLQKYAEKKSDIRITVVDNFVFSAELIQTNLTERSTDFRIAKELVTQPTEIPEEIANNLVLMIKKMGLRFSSCDFCSLPDGRMFFLEANVSGNFLWTELEAGLKITSALADALTTT